MKKLVVMMLMLAAAVSLSAQRPRPHPNFGKNLRGMWILENNQGNGQQVMAMTDSTYVLALPDYSGKPLFINGKYSLSHGKLTMTADNSKPVIFDFMFMGPKIRLSDDRIILIYRRARPDEIKIPMPENKPAPGPQGPGPNQGPGPK